MAWLLRPPDGFQPDALMDEQHLPGHVPLEQPPDLSFPDHVHHFIALNLSPSALRGPEPLPSIDSPLHRSVVLLDDVVQAETGSTPAPTAEPSLLLQLLHHLGIGGVAVDVDDAGTRVIRADQDLVEESLGSGGIAAWWGPAERGRIEMEGIAEEGRMLLLVSENGQRRMVVCR